LGNCEAGKKQEQRMALIETHTRASLCMYSNVKQTFSGRLGGGVITYILLRFFA